MMLIFFFVLGICMGSFSNVIIVRWPQQKSLGGRSVCPHCGHVIRWHHNIPLFSFFALKGQCADCRAQISIRYPLVELTVGLLFVGVYFFYGWSWTTLEYLIMVWGLATASFIDWEHMLLPDMITLTGLVLGLIGAALNPERPFLDGLFGFLFGGGVLWLVAYVYFVFTGRDGLGGGDIKLLAWLGSLLGWKAIPFIILSSSIIGSLIGLAISYRNSKQKSSDTEISALQTMIPFGPFIALGALLYIFGLKSVGLWYVDLFFFN